MDREDFGLQCERFSILVKAGTHTWIGANQGYLIPLCEQITLYVGATPVYEKMPWMDTFNYAWSFTSEIDQEVKFIRVTSLL